MTREPTIIEVVNKTGTMHIVTLFDAEQVFATDIEVTCNKGGYIDMIEQIRIREVVFNWFNVKVKSENGHCKTRQYSSIITLRKWIGVKGGPCASYPMLTYKYVQPETLLQKGIDVPYGFLMNALTNIVVNIEPKTKVAYTFNTELYLKGRL